MKYILGFLLVASISFQLSAKDKSITIKGQVHEQKNGEEKPLSMAYVYVDNSIYCTYTNNDGSFELELPKGDYSIKVSHLGYTTESINIKSKTSEPKLNISLNKNSSKLADK